MPTDTERSLLEIISELPEKWLQAMAMDESIIQRQFLASRPPAETAKILRARLFNAALQDIHQCFQLERCGLLLPFDVERKPGLSELVAHVGFPPELQNQRVYRPGHGLTGDVLKGSIATSADIVRDRRGSARFGDQWITETGERETEHIPRAFAGIPVSYRTPDSYQRTSGAVICIRCLREFTEYEIAALRVIAQLISHRIEEVSLWKQRADAELRRFEVRSLWQRPMGDDERYHILLELLQPEVPFKRILLSLVEPDGKWITGRAAIGFRPDLVRETRRAIFQQDPTSPSDEDVLARICRLRETKPRVATISDVHVNYTTALRHHVQNPLLLIPLVHSNRSILGVILAELPDSYPLASQLTESEQVHFSRVGAYFADLIESNLEALRSTSQSQDVTMLLRSLAAEEGVHRRNPDQFALQFFKEATRKWRYGFAALFTYCNAQRVIRRIACCTDDRDFPATFVPLESSEPGFELPLSCILEMVAKEGEVASSVSLEIPLDPPDDVKAVAIPLLREKRCIGAVVLIVPKNVSLASILSQPFVPLLSHLVDELGTTTQLRQASSQASATLSLIGMITALFKPLTEVNSASEQVNTHEEETLFNAILQDVSLIFQSQLAQFFRPESPVLLDRAGHIPSEQLHTPFEEVATSWRGTRGPLKSRKIKTADSRGLTASVLQSMLPQLSENVRTDPLWSQETREFGPTEVRSWMGVPLLVSHNGLNYCCGVLTTTRGRVSAHDSMAFQEGELRILRSIADCIAVAIFQQSRLTDAQTRVEALLRRFNHDLPNQMANTANALDCIEDALAPVASKLRRSNSFGDYATDIERLDCICAGAKDAAAGMVACFRSLLDLYVNSPVPTKGHPIDCERFLRHLRQLVAVPSVGAGIDLVLPTLEEMPLRIPCGNEEHIIYVTYILIHNAFKACREKRNNPVTERTYRPRVEMKMLDARQSRICITVTDNGSGLDPRFRGEGSSTQGSYWSAPGAGVGLNMAMRLVLMMNGQGPVLAPAKPCGTTATLFLDTIDFEGK